MGLKDRDYMRNRFGSQPILDRAKSFLSTGQGMLATATAVVAMGSGAVWLFRDARGLISAESSEEGTLVVNINTATQEQLETVHGIGPTRAAQIIAGRPYKSVEEIVRSLGLDQQAWKACGRSSKSKAKRKSVSLLNRKPPTRARCNGRTSPHLTNCGARPIVNGQ